MDYLIKCKKCGTDNVITRSNCKNCGAILEKKNINQDRNVENEVSAIVRTNKVASKFSLVVNIMKFLGYFATIIGFFALFSIEEQGFAFLCLICGVIVTWLSTLFFEAIAEGLQLLEDIKNK